MRNVDKALLQALETIHELEAQILTAKVEIHQHRRLDMALGRKSERAGDDWNCFDRVLELLGDYDV